MKVTEGFLEIGAGRTWHRVHRGDDVPDDATPLLMVHGGPGGASLDGIPFVNRIAADRPVIEYDQLDSGRSDRVSDPGRWTEEALVQELSSVREALGLDEVHIWGQSWGGMLAVAYVLTEPDGVRSVITSGAPLRAPDYLAEGQRARAALSPKLQRALDRCEATVAARPPAPPKPGPGATNDEIARSGRSLARSYEMARRWWGPFEAMARAASHVPALRATAYDVLSLELIARHVLRGLPSPPAALLGSFTATNKAMYAQMWGPSEFHGTGPIAAFDVLDRLHEIDVPVLVTSGRHELTSPDQSRAIVDRLPRGELVVFEDSSHVQPYEEPERYTQVLVDFLDRVERG